MKRMQGIHFYVNISNLDDVIEDEEHKTGFLNHVIHALDTYFTEIERYSKAQSENLTVEKVTGSRLHMYIEEDILEAFEVVYSIAKFAISLNSSLKDISKYSSLIPFDIQIGAAYGNFYSFTFKSENIEEETTIGYAANFAAKLQSVTNIGCLTISKEIYDSLFELYRNRFIRKSSNKITKYNQDCYYESKINAYNNEEVEDYLDHAKEYANKVNLTDMNFSDANKLIDVNSLSKSNSKKVNGVPLFADVRGFTSKFDSDDSNLEEMTNITQYILTSMYESVIKNDGVHIQFQGDRESALFHDYGDNKYCKNAVLSAMKMMDDINDKGIDISIGVGAELGKVFVTRIGAREEKDTIVLGGVVSTADRLEDDCANKNQIVIGKLCYEQLKIEEPLLASLFKAKDDYYFTTHGFKAYLLLYNKKQLIENNKNNTYNKPWGI